MSEQSIKTPSLDEIVMGVQPEAKVADGANAQPSNTETPLASAPDAEQVFAQQLTALTGDKLRNVQDFTNFFTQVSDYDALKAKVSELEAQPPATTFANDWVKKVNDMALNGVDAQQITSFAQLSLLDVEKLSPLDAIAKKISLEYPDMSGEHIQAYLMDTYGYIPQGEDGGDKTLDESAMPPGLAAKIRMEASAARNFIKEKQVAFESVQGRQQEAPSGPDAEMMRVQADTAAATWTPLLAALPGTINLKVDGDDQRPDYTFDFNPKPDVIQAAREALLNDIKANPGAFPVNSASQQNLQKTFEAYVKLMSIDDFTRALFNDVWASTRQSIAAHQAGTLPNRTAPTAANVSPTTGKQPLDKVVT